MKTLVIIVFIFISCSLKAQEEYTNKEQDSIYTIQHQMAIKPTKVAFYSAILPGLGQAYNKKYWKIPFVYGALATSSYFVIHNKNKYHEFREDFKRKKLGDESVTLSLAILQRAQEYHKKKRDGNILLTIGVYILQIVEASVDAHLKYHNVDKKLGFSPKIMQNPILGDLQVGMGISYNF